MRKAGGHNLLSLVGRAGATLDPSVQGCLAFLGLMSRNDALDTDVLIQVFPMDTGTVPDLPSGPTAEAPDP